MQLFETLPKTILSWQLKGVGFNQLGVNSIPDEIPFPVYGEDNIIGRVDAVGICYSDVKLVQSGGSHSRLRGRDLSKEPLTLGHEAAITVVGVGNRYQGKITLGRRYVLQPDVYYQGKTLAVGYQLAGTLSQYVVLGREVIEGDEGCYLIALPDQISSVDGALIEPWTCVAAAYKISARTHFRTNGSLRFYGFPGQPLLDLSGISFGPVPERLGVAIQSGPLAAPPSRNIIASCLNRVNQERLEKWAGKLGIPITCNNDPSPKKADDVVVMGIPPTEDWMAGLFSCLVRHSVISIHASPASANDHSISCDFSRIHYQGIRIVGRSDGNIAKAYSSATRQQLIAKGASWFVGGAGPMGQMHVLMALACQQPPETILVTDKSEKRLNALSERVSDLGLREPILWRVKGEDTPTNADIARIAPDGFDDIVILAPSFTAAQHATQFIGPGGYVNIFAGFPESSFVRIPLDLISTHSVRIAGTTGSPLSVMEKTLSLVTEGKLSPSVVLSAISDLKNGRRAVEAAAAGNIPGKIVVLPFVQNLGFQTLDNLSATKPIWRRALGGGRYWSSDAEALCIEMGHAKNGEG